MYETAYFQMYLNVETFSTRACNLYVRLRKPLNKQWSDQWYETP